MIDIFRENADVRKAWDVVTSHSNFLYSIHSNFVFSNDFLFFKKKEAF